MNRETFSVVAGGNLKWWMNFPFSFCQRQISFRQFQLIFIIHFNFKVFQFTLYFIAFLSSLRLWDLVRSYHHLRRVEKSSTSSSICMRCVQIISTTLKYSDFPHFHRDKSSLVKRKIYINFLDQSPPEKCKTFWLNEDKD